MKLAEIEINWSFAIHSALTLSRCSAFPDGPERMVGMKDDLVGTPSCPHRLFGRENITADVVAGVPAWYVPVSGLGIIRSAPRNYKPASLENPDTSGYGLSYWDD